jgi:hypothetical protein
MYPNPASNAAHGSEHIVLFEFLGRILGKALCTRGTMTLRYRRTMTLSRLFATVVLPAMLGRRAK